MSPKQILLIATLVYSALYANTTDAQQQIAIMKAPPLTPSIELTAESKDYDEKLAKVYSLYQQELQRYWSDPRLNSKESWVSYTPDQKSRSTVDFLQKEIILETITSNMTSAQSNLRNLLRRTITVNTKEAFEQDPLQMRVMRLIRPKNMLHPILKGEPILADILFSEDPAPEEIERYIEEVLKTDRIEQAPLDVEEKEHRYSIHIALPQEMLHRRSMTYQTSIAGLSQRFELPAPLIFSIIHTESSYNPFATSYLPGYGLMQVVPDKNTEETYLFLHEQALIPSAQYLYDGNNNIEMGSGHLHLLYYRHLKDIEDKNSRLYCTIAAYNAGISALTAAFSEKGDTQEFLTKVNTMSAPEVYAYLHEHLHYDTTKAYLQRVIEGMLIYYKAYGEDGRRIQNI